ncbi:MAG: hypothetical protein JW864_09400 [Spirochaetes bacterium]|nr:hypothetical protein [Spirochaetota bacterium]
MKILSNIKIFPGILICLMISGGISSGKITDNSAPSSVNWQKGFIAAKGFASIEFRKGIPVDAVTGETISLNKARKASYYAAVEISKTSITEAVKNLRIDSRNNMLDIMTNNPETQRIISEAINKSVIYMNHPSGFDSSACEARLNFKNIIESLPYDFPSNDLPVRAEIPVSTAYTGLIVDCRGVAVKPMLFPSIYSDEGLEIYGKNYINSNYAVKGGMVSYCYDDKQALSDSRAGQKPYYANAVKTINSCPVLSEKDTRRLLSSKITRNNLKQCRVILIIDTE